MTSSQKPQPKRFAFNKAAGFLSRNGWLTELSASTRNLILDRCHFVEFAAGAAIYRSGDPPDGLYGFVEEGIGVHSKGDDGELVRFHLSEPGFWIGDTALFSKRARVVTLVTSQRTTGLNLPQKELVGLVGQYPDLVHEFYSLSHRNLMTAVRLVTNLMISNSERRIAMRLLLYEELGGVVGGWIKLNQDDLATMVAVSTPTLHRALRKFKTAGAVELGYGKLRVIDRQVLIAASEA